MHLILASTSPRRKDLLSLLHIPFSVVEPDCEEKGEEGQSAIQLVRHLALQKSQSIAKRFPEALVLGGDTIIEIDGAILGKPQDREEATAMLRCLSGRTHQVHTGIALVRHVDQRAYSDVASVHVSVKPLSDGELVRYLDTGEPLGKAGGYCIQGVGGDLVTHIIGDYPAVVGLPLRKVAECLRQWGMHLPVDIEWLYRQQPFPNWNKFGSAAEKDESETWWGQEVKQKEV